MIGTSSRCKVTTVLVCAVFIIALPFPCSNQVTSEGSDQTGENAGLAEGAMVHAAGTPAYDLPEASMNCTEAEISSAIECAVRDFVETEWNTWDSVSPDMDVNNESIEWPDAPPASAGAGSDTSLASGLSNETAVIEGGTAMSESETGTVLYEDGCESSSGWTAVTSWTGELPVDKLQTGIGLLVDSGRYKSANIPSDPASTHGPMWVKQLATPPWVGEGLDLEVVLQHQYASSRMGHVGVIVYDASKDMIFQIHMTDGWYGDRSDAVVRYSYSGSQQVVQSVQKAGSWSGTLRIWYDRENDSIMATILGTEFTLVSDPPETELNRLATHVAIYFSNKQTYSYASKFIDYIKITEDTSPVTGYPAVPLSPAMEGHWFPKATYSRLYFLVDVPYSQELPWYSIGARIVADQDTLDRVLTVKADGVVVYSETIRDEEGFDGEVVTTGSGLKRIELQIDYGAHVDKGWKLLDFYVRKFVNQELPILGEYFPQASTARLTYQVIAGSDTRINVKMESDQDPVPRVLKVYVDGVLNHSGAGSDFAYEWSLGDYPDGSVHEILLELTYGGYAEWGKRLSINRVHRFRGGVEIDYMSGHCPTQEDLDVLEAYYVNMYYDRVEFDLNDSISHEDYFDLSTDGSSPSQHYWDISNQYRDHAGDSRWEWVLCCHYITWSGASVTWLGMHWGDLGIFIPDQSLVYLASWPWNPPVSSYRRTIVMHEYGHHVWILDWNPIVNPTNPEVYCINWGCAMATADFNIVEYPWYCQHHWSQRRWPGW